ELALEQVVAAEKIDAKIRAAHKSGATTGITSADRMTSAVHMQVITQSEADQLTRYNELRRACIMVDDFPPDVGRHALAEPASPAAGFAAELRKTA
ncbi:MAG: acyl-CoA dehydrogenase domain-containing protein, partial [Betaproteobacteria bacterium]